MSVEVAPRKPKTFRLPLALIGALETASVARGVPQTEIVEKALRQALGAAEEGPAAGPLGDAPSTRSTHAGREGIEPSTDSRAAPVEASAVSAPSASPQPRDTDTVGFATWLAGRTGKPRALCKRFVERGRVKVGGKVCKDAVIAYGRLVDVTLDGEAV